MIQTAALIALVVLLLCVGLNLIRVIRGPLLADRAIAADAIVLNLIGIVALYSIFIQSEHYYDLVLVFSLLGFVGTVCFAKFLGRGKVIE